MQTPLNNKNGIYLDYQATTPIDPLVLESMLPYMKTTFGNPHSSEHSFGWEANKAIEDAKQELASFINALEEEIIFTSGATEANNMAIIGMGYAALEKTNKRTILISEIEHKCVLGAARFLQKVGINVKKIPVLDNGRINLNAFNKLLTDDAFLVSVIATNNEIGTNQPLNEIGKMCKEHDAFFHVDYAQGIYEQMDVINNHIDLLSMSAHKMYGPKGVGMLFINQSASLKPLPIMFGGGQQNGYRSGTIPTALVAGFGKACKIMKEVRVKEAERVKSLRNDLCNSLIALKPEIKINGTFEDRHPGNLNILVPGIDARQLILSLQPKIAFSTGAACTSGIPEPSHVLKAIGLSTKDAESSFRISIGRYTTRADIQEAKSLILSKI